MTLAENKADLEDKRSVTVEVFVPGVMACSTHVEKGDLVAVSVAVEQPGLDGGCATGITLGTVLQEVPSSWQFIDTDARMKFLFIETAAGACTHLLHLLRMLSIMG